jgi:hypothetical protein
MLVSMKLLSEEKFNFLGHTWDASLSEFKATGSGVLSEILREEKDLLLNIYYFDKLFIKVAGYNANLQLAFLIDDDLIKRYGSNHKSYIYTFQKATYDITAYTYIKDFNDCLPIYIDLKNKLISLYGNPINTKNVNPNYSNTDILNNAPYYTKWKYNNTSIELRAFNEYPTFGNAHEWHVYIVYKSPNYE